MSMKITGFVSSDVRWKQGQTPDDDDVPVQRCRGLRALLSQDEAAPVGQPDKEESSYDFEHLRLRGQQQRRRGGVSSGKNCCVL